MNTYEITFQRENGTVGSDRFAAATEAQARRGFREVYRHGNGKITKVELISSDSPATKEQERKALEKIKKIVEELGSDSYVGAAFDGCFEIAEENIENDFACSMKQKYEVEHKEAEHFRELAGKLTDELEAVKKENENLSEKFISITDLAHLIRLAENDLSECKKRQNEAAEAIVKFAENPTSEAFCQAVSEHRNSTECLKEKEMRLARLRDVMQAYR